MVERDGMRRGSGGGCGWGGGVLGRWSLRRLLLDSPLVGRRLAHTGKMNNIMKIITSIYNPLNVYMLTTEFKEYINAVSLTSFQKVF